MLKIWGRKSSSNVQALMWCVGELQLPYERFDAGFKYGQTDTPEFLSMNPNGTVPVLQDDNEPPIWETGAILRYLCNRYGSDPFWPIDLTDRTHVDKWAEWSKINIAYAFTAPVFWRVARTAPAQQDPDAIRKAIAALTSKLAIAEECLDAHDFIAGREFTLADIQFGHILYRYYDIAIDRPHYPALRRYYERLAARPAYRDHVMISYDELRVP